jgi:hypothetical protein
MAAVLNEGRIRHPVFGNRRRWTTEWAPAGWWDRTVRTHQPRMRAEVERIINDVAHDLH